MSNQPTTRQELYDRIRSSSKNEVILEEMIRLGFWPADGDGPGDLATEMRRRSELRRELRALRTEQARLRDEEKVLKELRKQRFAEAREKRKETKARRLAEREARAKAWRAKQEREIGYLGPQVSGGLGHTECDREKLGSYGLPVFADAAAIARGMGITVGQLRFLAFTRTTSEVTHYTRFRIPKRTGGERLISAPMPRLKAAQHWILEHLLSKVPVHDAAHGFLPGRSIVTNARPHVGKAVVINLDLEDFFPTVTYRRVYGQFKALGYSPHAATILALICTEPEIDTVRIDGRTWHIARGERHLPQGAPTSPALTNILCRRLDRKLTTLAERSGFVYTRYADDLSFSSDNAESETVGKLMRRVRYLIQREGFTVHPDKTRVLRRAGRQEVTGIVVNDRLGVERATLRRFRAVLHQIEKDGPEGKTWGPGGNVLGSILGFANFVNMVDPEKGAALRERAKALCERHGYTPPKPPRRPIAERDAPSQPEGPDSPDAPEAEGEGKGEDWWKLW